jgi:zinc-ribbon domain
MAFCNSCGAAVNPGTKFCNKCGAPQGAAANAAPAPPVAPAPAAVAAPAPAAAAGGSSALKIILIVIAVIVGIGIIGVGTVSFFIYRVAKSSHVTQEGDHVKAETPFGSFETSKDPAQAAKDLGIDIYPGAEVQKNGTATASIGSIHTVTAIFESSDAPDKICSFYKAKFPAATVATSDERRCTIVANDQKDMLTINVEGNGDSTKLQFTRVSKKSN